METALARRALSRREVAISGVLCLTLTVCGLTAGAERKQPGSELPMVIKLTVDLGKDIGQNFGSLFEAQDASGQTVMGAGFVGVYNTRFRADRHTAHFFVRPVEGGGEFKTELLPRPSPDGGVYIFDLDGRLYALAHDYDRTMRCWNPETRQWEASPEFEPGKAGRGDALVRVGGALLKFYDSRVTYDGRPVIEPPEKGIYYNFYYAQGRLFFYHTYRAKEGGFTRLYACPWTPDREGPADLSKASVLDLTFVGETPFAYGQLRGEVLTCSNMGGLYLFDGLKWKVLRAPVKGVSYQVYSMINWHDRLLMAQYPTGELFEYDGEEVTHLKGWPPRIEGVSPSARESQTTMIYRGDLFVGVWPWAELWRYDDNARRWVSMGRMFRLPPVTDEVVHPFEREIREYNAAHGTKIVYNSWGQRITGMAAIGPDLMLSTAAKGCWRRERRFDFLTDEVWEQYGRVIRLHMPGNISAPIRWKDGPTQLEFRVEPGLTIKQVAWGEGVFGPFAGRILDSSAQPTADAEGR